MLDIKEAAELIGVPPRVIAYFLRLKRGPKHIKKGRMYLFEKEDVLNWSPAQVDQRRKRKLQT
jgi:DNA-binding transcriptional MerR regulator